MIRDSTWLTGYLALRILKEVIVAVNHVVKGSYSY